MELMFITWLYVILFTRNLSDMLFLLLAVCLIRTVGLLNSSVWSGLIFIMVYIGGVLVLILYILITNSNISTSFRFLGFGIYLSLTLISIFNRRTSLYRGFDGSLNRMFVCFIFLVLLLALFIYINLLT